MSELQSLGNGVFRVGSELTTESAPALWAQSRKLFPPTEASAIKIDVNNVLQVDSGGLALLVAWSRWANFREKQFSLRGASKQLVTLIENNHLEKLLYFSE